jgi:hypothetical protein
MATSGVSERVKNPEVGPYFIVPKGLIQSGIAARIGPHATAVYVALCEHANRGKRENQNTFPVSDRALAADTRVAERTIRDIRTKLIEEHLVTCVRKAGNSYTYTLISVQRTWVPVKDRPRQPKKRRALHAPKPAAADNCGRVGVQQTLPYPDGNGSSTRAALLAGRPGKAC